MHHHINIQQVKHPQFAKILCLQNMHAHLLCRRKFIDINIHRIFLPGTDRAAWHDHDRGDLLGIELHKFIIQECEPMQYFFVAIIIFELRSLPCRHCRPTTPTASLPVAMACNECGKCAADTKTLIMTPPLAFLVVLRHPV
jgi:hypothetical protein